MANLSPKTFFITGVSSGLGRGIGETVLDAGHTVVGTVRRAEDAAAFETLEPGRSIARVLDVTDEDAVYDTVEDVEASIGPIDVLVVNAGYGHEGVFEESPISELRAQFEVNVFGAATTMHAVLPRMRLRRAGNIFVVTSMGGLMTVPGMAYYCGSKYALEGVAEAVGKEVKALGVHVTAVAPGSFRTDWAGRSMIRTERSITDYDEMFEPIRKARQAASGNQLGNPRAAGAALLDVVADPNPPAHLLLGSDALRLVRGGRAKFDQDMTDWDETSRSTDFSDGAQIR